MSPGWRLGTFGTHSMAFESVPCQPEPKFQSDALQHGRDLFVTELNQPVAFAANKMIVLRIAVIVLVNITVVGARDLTNQACFLHLTHGAIDRRTADALSVTGFVQSSHDIVAIEVLVV